MKSSLAFDKSKFLLGLTLSGAYIYGEPATAPALPIAPQSKSQGVAVAFPWVFKNGTHTARTMAISTAEEIARAANYASIPDDVARTAWREGKYPAPAFGSLPTARTLRAYGKSLKAKRVLYGSVSWHTRSIWVNLGPKTISTATANVYVFDVDSGKVVYKRTKVQGRSDEKSDGYKVAAAILITPLVTAVSGGPKTPQEQRAVQIALATAYAPWVGEKK